MGPRHSDPEPWLLRWLGAGAVWLLLAGAVVAQEVVLPGFRDEPAATKPAADSATAREEAEAGDGSSERPPAAEKPAQKGTARPNMPAGRFYAKLKAAGFTWTYTIQVPRSYDGRKAVPLVVVLHGSGYNGPTLLDAAGWADQAESAGFIVVAPDGLPARPKLPASLALNPRIWNSGQHSDRLPRTQIDDMAFFRALLDQIEAHYRIDPARVYVAGHSNGGAMAFRLGAELSDRFTAVASVAGHCWVFDPKPAVPRPALFMVGTNDPIMPMQGGLTILPWNIRHTPETRWTIDRWTKAVGIPEGKPKVEKRDDGVWVETYGPNHDGVVFETMFLPGQGHGWPGNKEGRLAQAMERPFFGPEQRLVSATAVIWDFFVAHSGPGVAGDLPAVGTGDEPRVAARPKRAADPVEEVTVEPTQRAQETERTAVRSKDPEEVRTEPRSSWRGRGRGPTTTTSSSPAGVQEFKPVGTAGPGAPSAP